MIIPRQVPGFNIEDIPDNIACKLREDLPCNGGNCLSVEQSSKFGKWASENGVSFPKGWAWIVIWR